MWTDDDCAIGNDIDRFISSSSISLRRSEPQIDLPSTVGCAAVETRDARRIRVEGRHSAEADVDTFAFYDLAKVTERICADPEISFRMRSLEDELVRIFLHSLESSENS